MLSVVSPVYDEQAVLPGFLDRLRAVLTPLDVEYEVVVVNDGSRDGTPRLLDEATASWPQLRAVHLARNVGHQLALTAGLDHARGDWVVTIDGDLQDPPELIPELVAVARDRGVDVVYARRADRRSDSFLKRATAGAYYRVVRRAAGVDVPRDVGDYRLLSRRVVDALRAMPERHRVYRVLIPWLGYPSAVVDHRRDSRPAGRSKYSVPRMVMLAADSVASFSAAPLRFATFLGLAGAVVCLLLAAAAVAVQLAGHTVPGWASITVGMLFVGAVQLVCLGVLGEYVGRVFEEVKRRPLYTVARETRSPSRPKRRG
ncbi:MAG: glycosyltransferase family 2 protein [Mycobacteriales bacterium]|nr:glycosyltransferase family 2 protein [Frankia sp.]